MRFMKLGKTALVVALLVVAMAMPVGAACILYNYQYTLVAGPAYNYGVLLYYDFTTGVATWDANYGTFFSGHTYPINGWQGVFLYDYGAATYNSFLYVYLQY